MSRQLPVYIVLDTSGSMRGEPVAAVNVGLRSMLAALRQDPFALETVRVCVMTFDIDARVIVPLTPLDTVVIPEVVVPSSGATFLGKAMQLVVQTIHADVAAVRPGNQRDWRPLLFVMTDGAPSDQHHFDLMVPEVLRCQFSVIVACGAGPRARLDVLRKLTDRVVALDTMDASSFAGFFSWVSSSVSGMSSSAGTGSTNLPPPPDAVNIAI